jgi:SAM-dependent methyltransferase
VVDPTYVRFEDARRIAAREVIRRLPASRGRLLEVGCYTGIFLEEAQRAGFDCYGIEPSRAAADLCAQRGLRVAQGFVDQPLPWDTKFDLVVMWDVMEHLHDPLNAVRCIRELLAPGGEFHFTTVRIDCPFARIVGRRWPWFMPMHLIYFERESIEHMMRLAGFEECSIRNHFHYSQIRYLEKKLKRMQFPLSIGGHLLWLLPNLTVRISLGDTVYVSTKLR